MESASKKVTEISEYARLRGKGGGVVPSPLDDCRELSVSRLEESLKATMVDVTQQLLQKAEKAVRLEMYHLYMDARDLARDHIDSLGKAFREITCGALTASPAAKARQARRMRMSN